MIRKLYSFFQKETVLSISVILAVFSMFWIKPDHTYISYIDFRTLGLLFCLMTIVAGLKEIGVFDFLAEKMLSKAHGTKAIVTLLVLLCFFFSMVITNDVALITFVPLALIMLHKLPEELTEYWLIKVVVMQTIAANLGSMLTPIGNPQNLYLYAQADMSAFALIRLMLPYSVVSLILLLFWIRFAASKAPKMSKKNDISLSFSNTSEHHRENILKYCKPKNRISRCILVTFCSLSPDRCTYSRLSDSAPFGCSLCHNSQPHFAWESRLLSSGNLYCIIYFYWKPWTYFSVQPFSQQYYDRT